MNSDSQAWEHAKTLIADSNYADAFPIVAELHSKFPEDILFKRNLCFLAYGLEKFELVLEIGKELTELFPSSEIDSVGLFHTFIKLNHYENAFVEMERLLKVGESPEYIRLLAELTEEFIGRDDEFAKSILQRIAKIQTLEDELSKTGKRSELTHKIGSTQ